MAGSMLDGDAVQQDGGSEGHSDSPVPAVETGFRQSDEAARLKDLTTDVRDQDALERDVHLQADQILTAQANDRDAKRLERTKAERRFVTSR